jgi:transposase-like protein
MLTTQLRLLLDSHVLLWMITRERRIRQATLAAILNPGNQVYVSAASVVDEVFIGGKEANKHADKKLNAGRGTVGKTVVAGVRDRATGRVNTEVVEHTDKPTFQNFVLRHTTGSTMIYTDEASAYVGLSRPHEAVKHSAGEYVREMAHTNGLESHWALFKRGVDSTYHHISVKHLGSYSDEFEGRHNARPLDTADQMTAMAQGADGKRMRYVDLTGGN